MIGWCDCYNCPFEKRKTKNKCCKEHKYEKEKPKTGDSEVSNSTPQAEKSSFQN